MITLAAVKTVWFFIAIALSGPVGDERILPYMSPAYATRADCLAVWERVERTAFLHVSFCIEVPASTVNKEGKESS